jgi:hypothetical protein
MQVPVPLLLVSAALVILWGSYRIKLGLRSKEAEEKAQARRGLFGMPRRTHLLIGTIYVLLGVGLIAVAAGWNPLAWDSAPAEPSAKPDGVPVE